MCNVLREASSGRLKQVLQLAGSILFKGDHLNPTALVPINLAADTETAWWMDRHVRRMMEDILQLGPTPLTYSVEPNAPIALTRQQARHGLRGIIDEAAFVRSGMRRGADHHWKKCLHLSACLLQHLHERRR